MEILPVDTRDTSGFQSHASKDYQPTMILGWLKSEDGDMKALLWSPRTLRWLAADGVNPAVRLPNGDQQKITRLMLPTLRALSIASR